MKRIITLIALVILLTACAPSPQAIQTAIAQTQAANPTSTQTPIPPSDTPTFKPTETPTIISSPTLTPTLDLSLLQVNLKDFLLQKSDLPQYANYSRYVMEYNSMVIVPFDRVKNFDSAHLKETGRIDGWSVDYGIYNNGWQELIEDTVTLYKTPAGAQLFISKYSFSTDTGMFEEVNPPAIGDLTHSYFTDWGYYRIIFSYHNITHELWGNGAKNEITDLRNIAQSLLARLQASPLLNP